MEEQGQRDPDPDEADGDLEGEADDEDVDLGNGARDEAQADIRAQEGHDDGGRDLRGDDEHVPRQRDEALHQVARDVEPEDRQHPVAFRNGLDHRVVAVDGQEEEPRQHVLKLGDDGHLAARHGVDDVDDGKAHLEAHELAGHLDPRKQQPAGEPQDDPDEHLPAHAQAEAEQIVGGRRRGLHEGQDESGDENRQPPLDPQRRGPVPENRDHHQDRADPDEDEEEQLDLGGGENGEVHALLPDAWRLVPFAYLI